MDKIMTVELTGKGDTYATVTLPLTPYCGEYNSKEQKQ